MFTSINPATGKTIATHKALEDAALDHKLDAARRAYDRWRLSDLDIRAALLSRIGDVFAQNREELARMASEEMGKTYASALAEVDKCASGFRYYAEHGPAMLHDQEAATGNGGRAVSRWMAMGPVLAVMPWNFPYWQVVRFLAPAILAGNAGLLKHASNVQGSAALLEKMVKEADAPEGLFQNLAIESKRVGGIIADDRVAAVTLTGSEGAGMAVAEQAGKALKKVVLELGGSDPFIVMPSASIVEAVDAAVTARIQNSGQSCICGKRMIVHADMYDDFVDLFTRAMLAVKTGDPFDATTQMGPLSSEEQRQTVLGQLDAFKKSGANLVGGEALPGPGAFMSAGVLTDVDVQSDVAMEELFGPVAMVFKARDIDEAVAIANATPFGLGASVWTADADEQERFLLDIESGMVAINQFLASDPAAPFGGVKRSGHGRELSPHGLHEFMNLKTGYFAP